MKVKAFFAVASMATLMGCSGDKVLKSGIDLSNLDTTAVAGDDFYRFACGGWMEKNPLPAAYSRYGSFDVLAEENTKRINAILDELLKSNYEKGTSEQKLSDLYKLAMDSVRRDEEGAFLSVLMLLRPLMTCSRFSWNWLLSAIRACMTLVLLPTKKMPRTIF